jgi:hypothetical protein
VSQKVPVPPTTPRSTPKLSRIVALRGAVESFGTKLSALSGRSKK